MALRLHDPHYDEDTPENRRTIAEEAAGFMREAGYDQTRADGPTIVVSEEDETYVSILDQLQLVVFEWCRAEYRVLVMERNGSWTRVVVEVTMAPRLN